MGIVTIAPVPQEGWWVASVRAAPLGANALQKMLLALMGQGQMGMPAHFGALMQ